MHVVYNRLALRLVIVRMEKIEFMTYFQGDSGGGFVLREKDKPLLVSVLAVSALHSVFQFIFCEVIFIQCVQHSTTLAASIAVFDFKDWIEEKTGLSLQASGGGGGRGQSKEASSTIALLAIPNYSYFKCLGAD